MKNKRGLSEHIDWILGIAMFLLAVGFTITLFKPGLKPVHNSNDLITIIQDKFSDNIYWNITKVPIFIRPLAYGTTGTPPTLMPKLTGNYYLNFVGTIDNNGGYNTNEDNTLFSLIQQNNLGNLNIEEFYIRYSETDNPSFDNDMLTNEERIAQPTDPIEKLSYESRKELKRLLNTQTIDMEFGLKPKGNLDTDKKFTDIILPINLNSNAPTGGTKHLLIYNNDLINLDYSNQIPQNLKQACLLKCPLNNQQCEYNGGINNINCQAAYELGVTEKLTGISFAKFKGLETFSVDGCPKQGYDCIKKIWGFPDAKDFRITLEFKGVETNNGVETNQNPKFPESSSLPLKGNIFARRYNSFILTDDGETIPVTVRIQVW